jgi:steroid delta-isomerase-like uncharacterized protein
MSDANKKLVRQVAEEIWNSGNVQKVNDLFAKQCVCHDPAFPDPVRGTEAYKNFVNALRTGFPDFRVKIDDLIAEGDRVACHYTLSGTNSGDLKYGNVNAPATRKKAAWTGVTIFHCKDGKCVEQYIYSDTDNMRRQLGLSSEAPTKGMHA